MAELSIHLLGQFQVAKEGQPISTLLPIKAQALLAYLAVESGRAHARLALAGLLWPDQSDQVALHNLRQALTTLRQVIEDRRADPPFLLITRQSLQFNKRSQAWLDVAEFIRHINVSQQTDEPQPPARLRQAVELYHGDFLAGWSLDSVPFEEWLTVQREYFHRQINEALDRLAEHYEGQGQYEQTIHYSRRQIELNPWDELAHRRLMRCLALSGERNAALVHYERCRRLFRSELDVEPSQETIHLFQQIRTGEWDNQPPQRETQPGPQEDVLAKPLHNLPGRLTSFVSRDSELAQLAEYLAQPACRLITLVGIGGVGKTRLALEIAEQKREDFQDGVHFVPLVGVNSAGMLVMAIGSVLQLSFTGQEPPPLQLRAYLRPKQMLLILDSFEHLLAEVDLLIDLLHDAPELKLMVTSRERLNLQAEWLFPVEGLPYPFAPPDQADKPAPGAAGVDAPQKNGSPEQKSRELRQEPPEHFGAIRLFIERARQVKPQFDLAEEMTPDILHLCQWVAGLPLAIELAAAQVEKLSPGDIVRDLEFNLDRLATTKRDVPVRHRNLRALFDSSWERLEETEQALFKQLCIFRGSFGLEAAKGVALARPELLARLVDKSMIQQLEANRYKIHELLWRYGLEKLRETAAAYAEIQNRYCAYYMDFLRQREQFLTWGAGSRPLVEIETDIKNIRAAWSWAVEQKRLAEVGLAREALFRFYRLSNWLQEGAVLFGEAAAQLAGLAEDTLAKPDKTLKAELLLNWAYFAEAIDDYPTALAAAQRAVELALQGQNSILETKAYLLWGKILWRQGKHREGRTLFVQALMTARTSQHRYLEARSLHYLGDLYRHRGEHEIAQEHIQQALAIYRAEGRRQEEAHSLEQLGLIRVSRGNYATAQDYLEDALKIYQAAGDRHLEKEPLHSLGVIYQHLGLYETARTYFEQALTIAQAFDNRQAITITLSYLGLTHLYLNNPKIAQQYCREALTISQEIRSRYSEGYSLSYLGQIMAGLGDLQEAANFYRQALYQRRKIGQPNLALIDLAGLAWVTMAQGQISQALSQVEDILVLLETVDTTYLAELPQIYWNCYQVSQAIEPKEPEHLLRLFALLDAAYTTLQERAERIEDQTLRGSYLENVALHRQIIAAWKTSAAPRH